MRQSGRFDHTGVKRSASRDIVILTIPETTNETMIDTAPHAALLTDQYCLTMAQVFWRQGRDETVSFEMFVRSLKQRGYLVAAGLQTVLDYLADWRFTDADIAHLRTLRGPDGLNGLFDEGFLAYLAELRFTGQVDALAEGTVIGAQTPILRVTAGRIQATIVESVILSIVNHQTMIASKAARIVQAADGRACWDFSLRRLHGPGAALATARAARIAGFAGTATVEAGKLGIPTTGTMAHQFIMAYGEAAEQQAFEDFLLAYPDGTTLLIDTYDTRRGVERAIAASIATAVKLRAVRLDSGDLLELSKFCRERLDAAGMTDTVIFATNDLDEHKIQALLAAGAPIDAFGAGTMLGTSYDAPALGGVYKIVAEVAQDGTEAVYMKKAPGKQTDPGRHQVWRTAAGDVLSLADETLDGVPLMQPVMADGVQITEPESLQVMHERVLAGLAELPQAARRLQDPEGPALKRTRAVWELRERLGDPEAAERLADEELVA